MTLNAAEVEKQILPNLLPVDLKTSELVLHDEEGSSVINELDQLSSASESNFPSAAINIENSKDVIIGPVTQFNGPVTIYQTLNGNNSSIKGTADLNHTCYHNGTLIKSESTSSDASHTPEKPTKRFSICSKHMKYTGLTLMAIIIATITATAIILIKNKSDNTPTEPSEDTGTGSLEPVGSGFLITRERWHAHPRLNFTVPLKHPTQFVLISHSVTPFCNTTKQCSQRVKSMQEYHVGTLGSPDIGYNFVIGGDANAYVGRGWDIKNFHSNNSIGICFVGNYLYDNLTEAMISTTRALIDEGVQSGKLAEDYKLICHNQTYETESPGPNVYRIVKKWPHFDAGLYYT